ncbi:MAG TPA: hypothetical protein VK609_17940 [Mucilaginibacter sp.]|nr:hypothetical protein [Mucilaginibacter sp.]
MAILVILPYIGRTDVYFAGYDGALDFAQSAVYCKNGIEYSLPFKSFPGGAVYAMAISGTDTYFSGNDGSSAVYWKNGTKYTLSSTSSNAVVANAIAITYQ